MNPRATEQWHQDFAHELRERARRVQRAGGWEIGLGAAVSASLLGMLYCAFSEGRVQLNVQSSGTIFFGILTLLLMLAWLARERAKSVLIAEFEVLIEMAQRMRRTEQAIRDPLTGLFSRAGLEERLDEYLSRGEKASLALVIFDLDDFHNLNVRNGHLACDAALVEFAHLAYACTRGSDLLARYGGDEFVLLMSETRPEGPGIVISRVQARLKARNEHLRVGNFSFTFTAGFAYFNRGMTFEELFNAADSHLFKTKGEQPRTATRERL